MGGVIMTPFILAAAGPWGPLAIAGVLFAAGAVAIVAGRGRRSVR